MFFKKQKKDDYIKPTKTIFNGTNEEVLNAFGSIAEDVKIIVEDEEFPSLLINQVDEKADKAELGKLFVTERVGNKFYQLLKILSFKHPDNVYNILDTIFCAKKGTYKNRKFSDTIRDFKSIDTNDLMSLIRFFI